MMNGLPRLFFLFVIFVTPLALANFVGNDTSNFNPVPSGLDFITVHSSETLAPGFLNSGFFVNTAKDSLPESVDVNGNKLASKDSVTFSDISLAYGIAQNLDFGASLSYLLNQTVDRSLSGAQFAATGLNEIRLTTKYSFKRRNPVGYAVVLSMNLNQANRNPFSGNNGGATTNIEGVVDTRVGRTILAANLGYRVRKKGDPIVGAVYQPLGNQIIASFGMSYYLTAADTKLIGEIFMAKPTESTTFVDSDQVSSEALLGVKYDATTNAALHAGLGGRLSPGLFTPNWRLYVGANIALDTLKKPVVVAVEQAPQPPSSIKQVYKGYLPSDIDSLKDVSFDEMSRRHEFQMRNAIPEGQAANEAPPFEIIRFEHFDFDFGSAKIRPEYKELLDKLAKYLATDPPVIKIQVEGHTDSLGSLARNRTVSQERANALTAYLQSTGRLPNLQVSSVGYGADRPIADNSNLQGRTQNRRVEIRILRKLMAAPERVKTETVQP